MQHWPKTFRIRIHNFVWRTMKLNTVLLKVCSEHRDVVTTELPPSHQHHKIVEKKIVSSHVLFKQTRTQTTWLPPSWNEGKLFIVILVYIDGYGPAICAIVIVGYLENPLGLLKISVADPRCLSRIRIFSIQVPVPGPASMNLSI